MYKFRVEVVTVSQARLKLYFLSKKINTLVVNERFDAIFKLKNIGDELFPGGKAIITFNWMGIQAVYFQYCLPPLKSEDEKLFHETTDVLTHGFSLIFCTIQSHDGKEVDVYDKYGNKRQANIAISSINGRTWEEIYGFWGLVVSATSLFIIAIEKIILAIQYVPDFIRWLLFILLFLIGTPIVFQYWNTHRKRKEK